MDTAMTPRQRALLICIMLLAAAMHLLGLEKPGLANQYYAATVQSMMGGWHTFFFASFDIAGFVSVDKPPLGFWIQTGSALLFGFTGLSLLLPQAFAGILSVALLYRMVSRSFAVPAGLLAALILTLTPISVAANRNNTQDSLVVLASLLAAYAVLRAVGSGRVRWLIGAAVLTGAGFEIKMMQAFLILPAIFGVYLLAAPLSLWRRLYHLAVATVILLVVSLAWPLAVDMTPASQRPFVGSSTNNTVMELIVGHNGLNRLVSGGWRQILAQAGLLRPSSAQPVPNQPAMQPQYQAPPPNQPGAGPLPQQPAPAGSGIQGEIGAPGVLRLFNQQLGGQASWLLLPAVLGIAVAIWQEKLNLRSRRLQGVLLWLLWLAPQVVFFSVAALYHRYYLEMLSPAIAALASAGALGLWADYRTVRQRGWLLPAAIVAGAAVQIALLHPFPEWYNRLAPITGVALGAAAILIIVRCRSRGGAIVAAAAALAAIAALLVAPAAWAAMPVSTGGNNGLPLAGPDTLTIRQQPRAPTTSRLMNYLQQNRRAERFLVATNNANTAAPIILATKQAVMAMGGFSGGDRIVTQRDLEQYARDGVVRFFLLSSEGGSQPDLVRWIENRCARVADNLWQDNAGPGRPQPGNAVVASPRLFDCVALRR
jgi:4-amino-4-deoxy-L-arabinose transferase-like glycosyltransferase